MGQILSMSTASGEDEGDALRKWLCLACSINVHFNDKQLMGESDNYLLCLDFWTNLRGGWRLVAGTKMQLKSCEELLSSTIASCLTRRRLII